MLSVECERKLFNILKKLSFGERSVEIQRIIITEDASFSPHAAFLVLDSLQFNQLMPRSFIDFLPEDSPISEKELYLLIKQYSSRSNGRLSIDDFLHFVLPSTDFTLKELAVSRRVFPSAELTYSEAFALARLIQKEVELQTELEELKLDLNSDLEFSLWKAFKALDETGKGVVQEEDLMGFARKLGEYFSYDDIDAILRRIDTNDDMALDYNEFIEFLIPAYSEMKEEEKQKKSEEKEEESPEEESLENEEIFETPLKKDRSSEKKKESEELEIAKALLKTEVKFERMIEFMRENLSILTNFSIEQALEYFDLKEEGKADIEDLTDRLIELEVEFGKDELLKVVKRWANQEAQMGLEEFRKLFTPRNPNYSKPLENRKSEKFNEETLEELAGFFSALIDYERNFDSLQEASNLPDDPISESELGQALLKVGLDVPEQDMKLLQERYSSPIR